MVFLFFFLGGGGELFPLSVLLYIHFFFIYKQTEGRVKIGCGNW